MPRFLHFDSANLSLNRGNTNPFKEGGRFSDTGDSQDLFIFNKRFFF
jgi:hypothetical protein